MRRLLPLTAMLLALAAVSTASTINCEDQTAGPNGVGGNKLSNYIALGAGGCNLGSLLFSNFAYSYTLGTDAFYVSGPKGTGTAQTAAQVGVAVNLISKQFQFGANWVVDHYQTGSLTLSFTVSAPPLAPLSTLTNVFTATQNGIQNGGPVSSKSAVCSGGTCAPTNFTNSATGIPLTTGPLNIVSAVNMNAKGSTISSTNVYHLSIITNQFAQTSIPGQVPEPMTYVITGAGLVMLAAFRKSKRPVS